MHFIHGQMELIFKVNQFNLMHEKTFKLDHCFLLFSVKVCFDTARFYRYGQRYGRLNWYHQRYTWNPRSPFAKTTLVHIRGFMISELNFCLKSHKNLNVKRCTYHSNFFDLNNYSISGHLNMLQKLKIFHR